MALFRHAAVLFLVALSAPLLSAPQAVTQSPPPHSVTPDLLNAKIAETEANAQLPDETKTKLLELYRKALANLESAKSNAARAAAFQAAVQTAQPQTQTILEEIESIERTDPLATLNVDADTPLEQIDPLLKGEQADLAAIEARRTDFQRQIDDAANRPAAISERLAEAKQQRETAAASAVSTQPGESPALNRANRWVLETRKRTLSTEIRMLEQELLSQPMRVELLEAKLNRASVKMVRTNRRLKRLSEWVNRKRQREAEQAKAEAEHVMRETIGSDPVLVRLAERNTALSDELDAMTAQLNRLNDEQTEADKLAERIDADFDDARSTLEISGRTEGLGQLLLAQREALPDEQVYARRAEAHAQQIAAAVVRRLHHREEARRTADLEQTVAQLETQLAVDATPQLNDTLRRLAEQRQTLLKKALETDKVFLSQLRKLESAERKLLDAVRAHHAFLDENLLWLGSADPIGLDDVRNLPSEVRRVLSPSLWSKSMIPLIDQAASSIHFWLALLTAAALLWKRRALITAIENTAQRIGTPTTDRFAYTLQALILTVMLAAPIPLFLAVMAWLLQTAQDSPDLSHALGASLYRIAVHLFVLRALSGLCIPRGLAASHFRWPEASVQRLGNALDRLTWIFIPAAVLIQIGIDFNPAEMGGMIARLGMLVTYGAFAVFLYRIFHPRRGVLAHRRRRFETPGAVRSHQLAFVLLTACPVGLAALAAAGYLYSAQALGFMFLDTLWLIVGLIILNALALRWLLLVQRRLAYEAALQRRQAAAAATAERPSNETEGEEIPGGHFEEPEVDLAALSDETKDLLKIATIAAGLLVLYVIWSPLVPALRIFDEVTLWTYTAILDGENVRRAVTLGDLGLALIYAIAVAILATRLPALLEIILMRRFDLSSGTRYAITTLTNYAVVSLGIILILGTIGAQWAQLQWLVAALGVGIGFGLQEIVANFISGLVILFERPIRVGDIVTVGDTDGVVTKIRIRATTIRNWDRKELLVPNKDFITGRVLNWSLSDQMTRVVVVVGVAYGSDVDKALALMEEAAKEHEHVLDDPAPILSFEGFGEHALTLILRAYLSSIDYRIPTLTELHKMINRKFAQAGIAVALPQRDLHLNTRGPLRVSLESLSYNNSGAQTGDQLSNNPSASPGAAPGDGSQPG